MNNLKEALDHIEFEREAILFDEGKIYIDLEEYPDHFYKSATDRAIEQFTKYFDKYYYYWLEDTAGDIEKNNFKKIVINEFINLK